jgi:hypothetical protein
LPNAPEVEVLAVAAAEVELAAAVVVDPPIFSVPVEAVGAPGPA